VPHRHHINANAAAPAERRRPRTRADWVRGTLVELDADHRRLVLRVAGAGRPTVPVGRELLIEAGGARVQATDGDGDGRPGLRDLFPGDRLHVVLSTTQTGLRPRALRIEQRGMGAPVGGLRRIWEAA
jgi:hypothetical protein